MATLYPHRFPRRVYCAGPLFSAIERREMLEIADVLRHAGFDPFVPHADGMEFALVQPYLIDQGYEPTAVGQLLHEAVFALDTYQVVLGCGSLVVNLNGRVPDEGAVAESAMAWLLGKPMVAYKDDVRSLIAGRDNPLVVGQTSFETVAALSQLPAALEARIEHLEIDPATAWNCPAHLAPTLDAGERLWRQLCQLGEDRSPGPVAEAVLELFGGKAKLEPTWAKR